jgi:exonuclease SbcD
MASAVRPPGDGGMVQFAARGERAQVALLPFPSQRYVVTADLLLSGDAADAHAAYADRVVRILRALTEPFRADTVNLVVAHLMVMGGTMGGGERGAHTVFDYWVPATAFPAAAQYVALGHLHRRQQLAGPAPLHYCGSPLQLDFGETANEPAVNLVDVHPGLPADVRAVSLTAGRRLRTLRGTLADVIAGADGVADDHLRVVLDEPVRPGLADEVRSRLPNTVEVVLAPRSDADDPPASDPDRLARTPHDLLVEYLGAHDAHDERVVSLFDELAEELIGDVSEAPR